MMIKALVIGATAITLLAKPVQPVQYIGQFIVTDIKGDEIFLADEEGEEFIWIAEPGDKWETDDYAISIMNDNGTPYDVTDDIIERLWYAGHFIDEGVVSLY